MAGGRFVLAWLRAERQGAYHLYPKVSRPTLSVALSQYARVVKKLIRIEISTP